MNCPKCGGRSQVYRYGTTDGSMTYRKRKCSSCGHVFYTAELEVVFNDKVKKALKKGTPDGKRAHESTWVKVRCLDTGEIFESIKAASEHTGAHQGGIINCCRGRRNTAGGLRWEYVEKKEEEVKTECVVKKNVCCIG